MGKVSGKSTLQIWLFRRQGNHFCLSISLQLFINIDRCTGHVSRNGKQYGVCESNKSIDRENKFRFGHQCFSIRNKYSDSRRFVECPFVVAQVTFFLLFVVAVFNVRTMSVGDLTFYRAGVVVEPGWPCNGPLLRMAEDVAKRLLPAFDSKTGMPYGTVNLRTGVPAGETR